MVTFNKSAKYPFFRPTIAIFRPKKRQKMTLYCEAIPNLKRKKMTIGIFATNTVSNFSFDKKKYNFLYDFFIVYFVGCFSLSVVLDQN